MSLFYTITSYPPAVGGAQAHAHRIVSTMAQQFDVRTAAFWHTNVGITFDCVCFLPVCRMASYDLMTSIDCLFWPRRFSWCVGCCRPCYSF